MAAEGQFIPLHSATGDVGDKGSGLRQLADLGLKIPETWVFVPEPSMVDPPPFPRSPSGYVLRGSRLGHADADETSGLLPTVFAKPGEPVEEALGRFNRKCGGLPREYEVCCLAQDRIRPLVGGHSHVYPEKNSLHLFTAATPGHIASGSEPDSELWLVRGSPIDARRWNAVWRSIDVPLDLPLLLQFAQGADRLISLRANTEIEWIYADTEELVYLQLQLLNESGDSHEH